MKKIILFIAILTLQVAAFGQTWSHGQMKSGRWASTTNDSKGIFSQDCYTESEQCYWSMSMTTSCVKDVVTPILSSSDEGAAHLKLMCGLPFSKNGETFFNYYLTDFEAIDKIVRASKWIGLALPLENGQFRVVRFDLNNVISTIDTMRALAQIDISKKTKKSTKDKIL